MSEKEPNESERSFPKKKLYTKGKDNMYLKGCSHLSQRNIDLSLLMRNKPFNYQQKYDFKQFKVNNCSLFKLNNTTYSTPEEIIFAVPDNAQIIRKIRKESGTDEDSGMEYYHISTMNEDYPIFVLVKDKNQLQSNFQLNEANIYLNPIEPQDFMPDEKELVGKQPQDIKKLLEESRKIFMNKIDERESVNKLFSIDTIVEDKRILSCPKWLNEYTAELNREIEQFNLEKERAPAEFKKPTVALEKDISEATTSFTRLNGMKITEERTNSNNEIENARSKKKIIEQEMIKAKEAKQSGDLKTASKIEEKIAKLSKEVTEHEEKSKEHLKEAKRLKDNLPNEIKELEEKLKKENIKKPEKKKLKKCISKDFTIKSVDKDKEKSIEKKEELEEGEEIVEKEQVRILDNIEKSILIAQEKDFTPIVFSFDDDVPLKDRVLVKNKNIGTIQAYKIVDINQDETAKIEHNEDLIPNVNKDTNDAVKQAKKNIKCPNEILVTIDAEKERCSPVIVPPAKRTPPSIFNKLYDGIPTEVRIISAVANARRKGLKVIKKPFKSEPNDSVMDILRKRYEIFTPYEKYGYIIAYDIKQKEKEKEKSEAKQKKSAEKQSVKPSESVEINIGETLFFGGKESKPSEKIESKEPIKKPVEQVVKEEIESGEEISEEEVNEVAFFPEDMPIKRKKPTEEELFKEPSISLGKTTKLPKTSADITKEEGSDLEEKLKKRNKFD